MDDLRDDELLGILERTFALRPEDGDVGWMTDLPDARRPDHPAWASRRERTAEWCRRLDALLDGRRSRLFLYRHAGTNNGDLPATAVEVLPSAQLPASADDLPDGIPFTEVFEKCSILLAPTELSATAPLKVAVRGRDLRAATMPGFTDEMIPALRLDQIEIDRRCRVLASRLDAAETAEIRFRAERGDGRTTEHRLVLDLRHNPAHPSGGLVPEPGSAGNLPSGETYVVPWEGTDDDPSRSRGTLPVELDGEVVVYRIEGNRAIEVEDGGPVADRERRRITEEPAYANLAELGLGVLGDFGVRAVGAVLLDEKLGLHIAFGRSDHFGGRVGPGDFSSPSAVVHIDRVFLAETQPHVRVPSLELVGPDGSRETLMRDGAWSAGLWT